MLRPFGAPDHDWLFVMITSDKPVIPFNRPTTCGQELILIKAALESGHYAGDGAFTQRCARQLESILSAKRVLLTSSCTHALEMAALLLDIKPGDEVIVPSYTFVSTANAFVLRGASIVFADVRPETLNLDERGLGQLISSRTRAVVPVHYAGVACEMDAILETATRHDVAVVEDNAHGLFGKYKGRWLGTLGNLGTQSFHETKNITCGEGGALLVNDAHWVERAEIIREKGTNRSRFFRGQVDKYSWVDIGSSYLLSDLLAAMLAGQLETWSEIQGRRRAIWESYHTGLAVWAAREGVRQPWVPPHCEQAWHMYYLLLPSLERRMQFIAHLKARGIQSVFHYLPLHLSAMGKRFAARSNGCPVAEQLSERLVRLPFFNTLSESEQARVIEAVCEFQV